MQGKQKYLIDKMLKHVPFYPIFKSDEQIELVTKMQVFINFIHLQIYMPSIYVGCRSHATG
jgi:hypothetical protein